MTKRRKIILISILALALSGDSMMMFIVTWLVIEAKASLILLGGALAAISAIPILLHRFSGRIANSIRHDTLKIFLYSRLAATTSVGIACVFTNFGTDHYILYGLLAVLTVLGGMAQQALETHFATMTLDGTLSGIDASVILQTSAQLGATFGIMLIGFILTRLNITWVLATVLLAMAVGMVLPLMLADLQSSGHRRENMISAAQNKPSASSSDKSRLIMFASLTAIATVSVEVGAFNLLAPLILRTDKGWNAVDYGIVSAAASLGAILSSLFFCLHERHTLFLSTTLMAMYFLFNATFVFGNYILLAVFAAFCMGAANTFTRIVQRKHIFDHIASHSEGAEWGTRVFMVNQLGKILAPVLFSILITYLNVKAGSAFIVTGFVVSLTLSATTICHHFARRKHVVHACI